MRERTKAVVEKGVKLFMATLAAEPSKRAWAFGRFYGFVRRVHEHGRLGEHVALLNATVRTRLAVVAEQRRAALPGEASTAASGV